jgi:hypothetical protein
VTDPDEPPPAAAAPAGQPPTLAGHGKAPGSRLVALLLSAAALVAGIVTVRAAFLSNDAGGLWQQSLRQEVKAAAGAVEDIRFVYGDEARQAFRYASATVREEEFRKAADGLTGAARDAMLFEADVQARVAASVLSSSEVAGDPRYALPGGAYDLILRLVDTRQRAPGLVALDPDATQAHGDLPASKAVAMMATTVPIGFAFMLGALAQAFVRRRRILLALSAGALAGAVILAIGVEVLL